MLDAVTRVVQASVERILKDRNHILQIFDVKNVALIKNVMMEMLIDGNLWFCNEVKTVNSNRVAINCHAAYHKSKFGRKKKTTTTETFSSPVSSMQQQQKKRRRATPTTETSILPPLKRRTKITSRTRNAGTVGSVTRTRRNMVGVRNQTFQSPSYIPSPTEPATSSTTTANLPGMRRFV